MFGSSVLLQDRLLREAAGMGLERWHYMLAEHIPEAEAKVVTILGAWRDCVGHTKYYCSCTEESPPKTNSSPREVYVLKLRKSFQTLDRLEGAQILSLFLASIFPDTRVPFHRNLTSTTAQE